MRGRKCGLQPSVWVTDPTICRVIPTKLGVEFLQRLGLKRGIIEAALRPFMKTFIQLGGSPLGKAHTWLQISLLGAVYYVAARWGLNLMAVNGFASPIWAPTAISLVALLRFGYSLWPGVFLGALFANQAAGASFSLALVFGVGNTLEALTGCYLFKRFGLQSSLARIRDVVGLILVAVVASAVSATIGTTALWVANRMPSVHTWNIWWRGDLLSIFVLAPFLLVWLDRRRPWDFSLRRAAEALLLLLFLGAVSHFVFAQPFFHYGRIQLPYLILPLLIWASLRFGPSYLFRSGGRTRGIPRIEPRK